MSSVKHPQHILAIKKSFVTEYLNSDKSVNPMFSIRDIGQTDFFDGANSALVIARRQELESNEEYLQILPYVLLARSNGVSNTKDLRFLTYYRPSTGGESRLHGNASIGFGGHIDLKDIVCDDNSVIDFKNTVLHSMRRELFEELGINEESLAGVVMGYRLITDYSNSVGRVHLGIVFIVTLKNECVIDPTALEIDYAGEFTAYDLAELSGTEVSNPIVMENWSKLLVEEIQNNPSLEMTSYYNFLGVKSISK